MDQLERGPLPISVIAPANTLPPPPEYSDSEDDDVAGGFGSGISSKSSQFEPRVNGYRRLSDLEERESGIPARTTKFNEDEAQRHRDDCSDGGEDSSDGNLNMVGKLAAQMKEFAERFVRIERKKMEVMRENERYRMEMENKRLEMILVSQQKTVDMISKVFDHAPKKMKMTQDL